MQNEYSFYLNALCACYEDIARAYPAQYSVDHKRDLACIRSRFACEGLSFLTKTLPSLVKAIDTALALGTVLQVPSFARKKGSKLPRFLGWLIGQVFSTQGTELDSSNPVALVHIRQLLLFYKLEMPYDTRDTSRIIAEFKSVDQGLNTPLGISDPSHVSEIRQASRLIARVLSKSCPRNIIPKHGPGSVASGEKAYEKPYFRRDFRNLTDYYSIDDYFYLNASHMSSCLTSSGLQTRDSNGSLRPWEELDTPTAKVVFVPKDSRGPRLISMEPLEIQWIQQGQMECLVKHIESNWLTKGHVNFEKQDINRYLAFVGSQDSFAVPPETPGPVRVSLKAPEPCAMPKSPRGLVTLDMKEASDRVSYHLVSALFPLNWVEALMASRSSHTMLPNGEVVPLNKFAPMGSAVCFPVEALCFWALAVAGVLHARPNLRLREVRDRVWVYGDDIVCYREDYPIIKQSLERVGLLLNASKCCIAGSFRESCGLDAYKGVVVTPLRIKKRITSSLNGQTLSAYVSYSNDAYARGYTNLAEFLEKNIQQKVKVPYTAQDLGHIQFVRPHSNVRALNRKLHIRTRFCRDLHVLMAYGPAPKAVTTKNHAVTYESFFPKFLQGSRVPSRTPLELIRNSLTRDSGERLEADQYPVPRRVSPKRGWKHIIF